MMECGEQQATLPNSFSATTIDLWDRSWLREAQRQIKSCGLHCPFVWLSDEMFDSIQEEMLSDLFLLCSSLWETIVCHLLLITRDVFLNIADASRVRGRMDHCYRLILERERSPCPLIQEYHASMRHVLDTTWVVISSVLLRTDVTTVITFNSIPVLEDMSTAAQSAVWAIRAQVMRACCYNGELKSNSLFDYVKEAERAFILHQAEGSWCTLFGSALPKTDSRKRTLLDAGFSARRTPYTSMEYATHLAKSVRSSEGITFASLICEMALRDWPDSLYVNTGYVLLFLRTPCRNRLSGRLAVKCLVRAFEMASHSRLLPRLAEDLSKCPKSIFRRRPRVGSLSPISEEDHSYGSSGIGSSLMDSSIGQSFDFPGMETSRDKVGQDQPDSVQDETKPAPAASRCNCVCSSICASLTYKAHGTLRPPAQISPHCGRQSWLESDSKL